MKINPKSQKGSITLTVLVGMLCLTVLLMSMYIRIANKAQTSAESTKQIAEKYNNIGEIEDIYASYFSTEQVIPIYTAEDFMNIDNDEVTEFTINGKVYEKTSSSAYILMADLTIDASEYSDFAQETVYNKINSVIFEGNGHKITVNNLESETYVFTEENSWSV